MRPFLLASTVAVLLVGCSSEPADPASNDADFTEATAEKKLTCDSGAAALNVDRKTHSVVDGDHGGEFLARDLEFVVHDRGVVDFLSSKVAHIQNAGHEIVLRGSLRDGEDFDFFEDWSFGYPTSRPEGNQVRVNQQVVGVVHRVHGEANRVRIVFNNTTQRMTCSTYFEEDHCAYDSARQAPGELKTERSDSPIADWVFTCL